MAKSGLSVGLQALRARTEQIGPRFDRFVDDKIDEAADEGATYMRTKAPWRDDTGNRKDRVPGAARAGLHTEVRNSPLVHEHAQKRIVFAHTVFYGIFLETKHNGKFQIIMPAVKVIAESLMSALEDGLGDLSRGA